MFITSCTPSDFSSNTITDSPPNTSLPTELFDSELLSYAQSSYNQSEMMDKDLLLGSYHGNVVRVQFPCSDVCPMYTERIIFYDVPLPACTFSGAEVKKVIVPEDIGAGLKDFCVPTILIDSYYQLGYDKENNISYLKPRE